MLTLALLLFTHNFTPLSAQKTTTSEELILQEKYWNNSDYRQAETLRTAGKEIAARPYYEKASTAAKENRQWEMYFLSKAYLSISYAGSPDYQKGIQIANDALNTMHTLPDFHHKHVFRVYLSLSNLYRLSYQREAYLEVNHKALALLKEHYPLNTTVEYAEAYLNLGIGYQAASQLDQGLKYFRKAEAMLDQLSKKEMIAIQPQIYSHIGTHFARIGNFEPAARYLEQALKYALIAKEGKDEELFTFYHDIATVYGQLNENEKSIEHYKKAAYIVENLELENARILYMQLPMIYLGIAENYSSIQDYDAAVQYCQQAVNLIEQGKNSAPPFISLYAQLHFAKIYLRKNDLDQALHFAQKADELYTSNKILLSRHKVFQALSHHIDFTFAKLYNKMGQLNQAKHYYQKIKLALADKSKDEQQDFLGLSSNTMTGLADVYDQQGQRDSAFYYNQLAIIAACQTFENLDHMTLPTAEECVGDPQIFYVLNQKAEIFQHAALDEQEPLQKRILLDNGLKTIDLMDEIYSENLKKINVLRGGQSKALVRQGFAPYQTGMNIAYQRHQLDQTEASIEKGFYFAQKIKAQQLWLSLLKSEATHFGNLDLSILEKERDLLADITQYERKAQEARQKEDFEAVRRIENDVLFHKQKEYTELQRSLENQYPEYFESKYAFTPENGSSLQKILAPEEILIEYVFTNSTLLIFTLTKERPLQLTKVPVDPEMPATLEKFHNKLQHSSMMRRSSREQFIQQSHQLYTQFIDPIESQIATKSRLLIIGDGLTNYIPFEALLPTDMFDTFHELDFLIKSFEFSYHYSATLFAKARRKPARKNTGIYAFAPVYDKGKSIPMKTSRGAGDAFAVGASRAAVDHGEYAHLPESEHEVREILKLFEENGTPNNTLALRQAASESALKQNLSQNYQFVHIAGHSFANLENPKFSGIACYQEEDGAEQDGVLHTGEIYNISTKADLVTLSSCESGYGKLERTEGMLGLNRAFIYSGTPNVIYSLWKVYDKVSAKLMVNFYQEVMDGKSYAASLRKAKLNLLAQPDTAAPHFWSPYLLIGS